MNQSPLRILVIGCGSIGTRHIGNLKASTKTEVIACDRDKQRRDYVRDNFEIAVFRDYNEAIRQNIQAVLVCTPTSAHIAPALAAIKHGCHVFIEKPFSHTLNKVDALIKEAASKNLVLMSGFNFRFHPAMVKMKNLVESQAIGDIISLKAHAGSYFLYRTPFHSWMDYHQDYAAKKIGGGVILDSATHHIDYITSILGDVQEVSCYAGRMGELGLQAEDVADILLKLTSGAVANLHVNFVQQPYQNKYEIIGQKGTIAWDGNDNIVRLFTAEDNRRQSFPADSNFDHNQTYIQELNHFLACISGKERPLVDGARGKRVLEIALAAKKSAKTGRVVKVNQ